MTASLMTGHAPIAAEILSRDELLALAGYEQTIERGFKTFVEVGTALAQIHEQRLYRAQYATFEEYCEARWDFTGRRGRQLIEAAAIGRILPIANAGQAAELAKVPEADRAAVLAEAAALADGKPTAAKIAEVAKERKSGPKPDLKPAMLAALAGTGRDGLTLDGITDAYGKPAEEKDLRAALDSLTASGEIVVTATWANKKPRRWALPQLPPEPPSDDEVLGKLATFGTAGASAWQVAFLLGPADETVVAEILEVLTATGQVDPAGREMRGNRMVPKWAIAHPETPGPVEAEAAPPADPGTTPEPATADAPAGVAGSGTTSPEPEPDALCEKCGHALDRSEAELGYLRCGDCDSDGDHVAVELADGGTGPCRACHPEPETCLGSDMDCGRTLPCPDHPRTPAERIAAVADVAPEFVRPAEPYPDVLPETIATPARRSAIRLVAEVTELVGDILAEPELVTPEMVAALREQADRLEQVLGGAA